MAFWIDHIGITDGDYYFDVDNIYIPHKTRRGWTDELLDYLAPVKGVMVGNLNSTPTYD